MSNCLRDKASATGRQLPASPQCDRKFPNPNPFPNPKLAIIATTLYNGDKQKLGLLWVQSREALHACNSTCIIAGRQKSTLKQRHGPSTRSYPVVPCTMNLLPRDFTSDAHCEAYVMCLWSTVTRLGSSCDIDGKHVGSRLWSIYWPQAADFITFVNHYFFSSTTGTCGTWYVR